MKIEVNCYNHGYFYLAAMHSISILEKLETVRLELEVKGKVPSYLRGQIALLRLAEKRYVEARQEFKHYFQSFGDGKPSSNPMHIPIIEGYEQLLLEIAKNPVD